MFQFLAVLTKSEKNEVNVLIRTTGYSSILCASVFTDFYRSLFGLSVLSLLQALKYIHQWFAKKKFNLKKLRGIKPGRRKQVIARNVLYGPKLPKPIWYKKY